jgi:hypothetical protein
MARVGRKANSIMIYEFITPSDEITFSAPSDPIAYACSLLLGRGKAGCTREDGHNIPCLLLFASEAKIEASVNENLGMSFKDFAEANSAEIADALDSFAYCGFHDRKQHDAAIAEITDPAKLSEFKANHEDTRTSMSRWVKGAWGIAAAMRKKQKQIAS